MCKYNSYRDTSRALQGPPKGAFNGHFKKLFNLKGPLEGYVALQKGLQEAPLETHPRGEFNKVDFKRDFKGDFKRARSFQGVFNESQRK